MYKEYENSKLEEQIEEAEGRLEEAGFPLQEKMESRVD
jgi:hypothetical protein